MYAEVSTVANSNEITHILYQKLNMEALNQVLSEDEVSLLKQLITEQETEKTQVLVTLSKNEKILLQQIAENENRSVANLIATIIKKYLKDQAKK